MNNFLSRPLVKRVGYVIIVALIMNGALVIAQWYLVSPNGGRSLFTYLLIPTNLLLLFSMLAIVGSIFLIPFKASGRKGLSFFVCGVIYVAMHYAIFPIGMSIRMSAFNKLAERSGPLIEAIEDYVEKEEQVPASLDDLVPDYLSVIPTTGMPSYPDYNYSTDASRWDDNPWVVYINTPLGLPDWSMFVYFPKQNYPELGYGGWLQRVGGWAYVHE